VTDADRSGDDVDRFEPLNAYTRDSWDWPFGDAADVAEPVTDRLAVLPDGIFLRRNPPEQPSVEDVLQPGTLIRANYHADDRTYKVFKVSEREVYGLQTFTVAIGSTDQAARGDGLPKNYSGANIKELVYQDGCIRKLFWDNDDRVEVLGSETIDVDYQPGLTAWSA